ncbi:MAG: uroporphyrinogen decarboxylase family protein [Verrucomicrobiota bacterium]|nr:uroporphyrinogen decarboxylase family protein [Verrucomicrobiota bacterium]
MLNCKSDKSFDISKLQNLYQPNNERIELAKRRQKAVWEGNKPDAWPIIINGTLTRDQQEIPAANYKEAFYSDEMMLCAQMRSACASGNSNSDSIPSIRSNLGTGICLSLLGLSQDVFSDKMPWLREHLTLEQVAKVTPEDIVIQGDFERGLRQMNFFMEVMGDSIPVYCMDTQGPFDIAHLMMGDNIFYLMHDDPSLVHHIMNIALEIGIKAHRWMKEQSGEPMGENYHDNSLYAENMGIRICEDTSAIIGADDQAEFALPYTKKLASYFGGAWVHYCGRNDSLTKSILEIEEVRGINFGHIPGHEHDHPFEEDMENILQHGKVYYGRWPYRPGEDSKKYLKRIHRWASQGALIPCVNMKLDGSLKEIGDVLDFWYSL